MEEQELIEKIRSLTPMVEAHASEAERIRKPVDKVMQAIEETQVYRYFVPTKYGGYEFRLDGFMDLGMILGAADLSIALVVTLCMEHNWLLGFYNEAAPDDILG